MDSEYYLEPDFDPATLKVAELRGVLLKHDVDYPSNAKKAELVELFNTHVAPQAAKLRKATARVKPSSRAITNAGASAEPEETPRRRTISGRKSKTPGRVSDVDLWGDMPKPQSPSSVRSTRRSSARPSMVPPPQAQEEVETDDTVSMDGPFSNYNPFQQGSSPMAPASAVKSARKSLPAYETKRRSTSGRKSDSGPGAGAGASSYGDERYESGTMKRRKQTQAPAIPAHDDNNGIIVKNEEHHGYGMDVGEEFVPEEAAELAEMPRQDVITRRPGRASSGRTGTGALSMIVLSLLLAYGVWWRREKFEAGYCGVGGLDVAERDGNTFADLLRPECETCPPHAMCYPGMDLECERDYIKVDKWISLGGLIPIPPECAPDTEKERRKAIMSNAALEILRENGAEQRCKERFLNSDTPIKGVSEEDLRQVLYDRKAASLSDREFSELWRLALEDVTSREEVIAETDDNGFNKFKSTSLAPLPLSCQIRFFVAGSLARYRVPLAGITSVILAILYLRASFASSRSLNEQVTKLVHISLRYLALHAEKHPENPAIAVAHLRDQVLRAEFNPQKRRKLWEGVEKIVEQNSNVRAGEREIQGEIMRAWTWIGGRFVGGGEDALLLREDAEMEWDGRMRPIA